MFGFCSRPVAHVTEQEGRKERKERKGEAAEQHISIALVPPSENSSRTLEPRGREERGSPSTPFVPNASLDGWTNGKAKRERETKEHQSPFPSPDIHLGERAFSSFCLKS